MKREDLYELTSMRFMLFGVGISNQERDIISFLLRGQDIDGNIKSTTLSDVEINRWGCPNKNLLSTKKSIQNLINKGFISCVILDNQRHLSVDQEEIAAVYLDGRTHLQAIEAAAFCYDQEPQRALMQLSCSKDGDQILETLHAVSRDMKLTK